MGERPSRPHSLSSRTCAGAASPGLATSSIRRGTGSARSGRPDSIHCSSEPEARPPPHRHDLARLRTCRSSRSRWTRRRSKRHVAAGARDRERSARAATRGASRRGAPPGSRPRGARRRRGRSRARSSRVHPHEQVLVEGGRDAERIVVGEQQLALRLDEVGAEEQRVARPQRAPDLGEELVGGGRIEVADVRAEEEDEHRPRGRPLARPRAAAPPRRSRGGRRPRRARSAPRVRSDSSSAVGRDVDQVDDDAAGAGCAAPRRASRASRRCRSRARRASPDPSSGATISAANRAKQPPLGPRDPVPGQPADRLEESGAERVVEVLRLELLGRRARGPAGRRRRSRGRASAEAESGDRRRCSADARRLSPSRVRNVA